MKGDVRFIGNVKVTEDEQGRFRDESGTIFAVRRKTGSLDSVDRCGISPFTLPDSITPEAMKVACRVHDYMYESPVFQSFYPRDVADEHLEYLAEQGGFFSRLLAKPFKALARLFGARAWENKTTNN